MIREAQTKDLLAVSVLLKSMIEFSEKLGTELFTDDPNMRITGIFEYVILSVNDPESIVLVDETEAGIIKGVLIGCIKRYPKYLKHSVVGEISSLYPVSFATRHLKNAFDVWREEKGATATSGYVLSENEICRKIYEKHGMKAAKVWVISGSKEQKCMTSSEAQK